MKQQTAPRTEPQVEPSEGDGRFFLIGLSAIEADVRRNSDSSKIDHGFDIPIVYTNGGRASWLWKRVRPVPVRSPRRFPSRKKK